MKKNKINMSANKPKELEQIHKNKIDFNKIESPQKLSHIAEIIGCSIAGPHADKLVHGVSSLEKATEVEISFLSNKKYINEFQQTKAGFCIVPGNLELPENPNTIVLKSTNAYFDYAKIVDLFYSYAKDYTPKISPSAYISDKAAIGDGCYIGHNVVIEDYAHIGDGSIIESGSFIDYGVKIGARAQIGSNVSISYTQMGDDVVILSGARIGQDGFGFATDKGKHKKIYHAGKVVIGNDVEIGANTTIDRGSMNDTIIEDMCRIDNLVQIGHNVQIQKGSIVVAQVGIAGSTKIGSYCALGGQVGVAGHIKITDQVQISGQGGVIQDINTPGIYGGTPAVPISDWHRQSIMLKKMIKKA